MTLLDVFDIVLEPLSWIFPNGEERSSGCSCGRGRTWLAVLLLALGGAGFAAYGGYPVWQGALVGGVLGWLLAFITLLDILFFMGFNLVARYYGFPWLDSVLASVGLGIFIKFTLWLTMGRKTKNEG